MRPADLVVLGSLDPKDVDVAATVPARASGDGVIAVETETTEDDSTLVADMRVLGRFCRACYLPTKLSPRRAPRPRST